MAERTAEKKLTQLLDCYYFSDIFHSTQEAQEKEVEKEEDLDPVCLS